MKLVIRKTDLTLAYTWTIARGPGTNTGHTIVVELHDGQGVVGLGETAPSRYYHESLETVTAFLAKVDPSRLSFDDVAGSMAYLDTVAPGQPAAKCAVNIALVDGAARKAGQPIYDHLGLGFQEGKHPTSYTIGIDTPEVIRMKVEAAACYPILKLKVGVPGDHENFAALRSVAPTKIVRVDANEGWKTKEDALRNIEWLKADGYVEFIEQALPMNAPVEDFKWLKERSPIPLFADESYHTAADADRAAECFHGVNVKLIKTGGISGAYAALKAARDRGLQTMIGCMIETSILITAAAHLAELTDHLDIDGNILIKDDPYKGCTAVNGMISFASAPDPIGLRVRLR